MSVSSNSSFDLRPIIDLTGKCSLVTGATGQLGRVITLTLASCGSDVIIQYFKNEDLAISLSKKIQKMGRKSIIIQADVTRKVSVDMMATRIREEFSDPMIVVCGAVIKYNWKSVLDQDLEDFDSQYRCSVLQSVLLIKTFLPSMMKNNWGRFIAISTENVMQEYETQAAYVAGKRGMDGLLRVLTKEVGRYQITVNQVAPGWVITDKHRQSPNTEEQREQKYIKNVPLGRRGEDKDVANLIAFLASDCAKYITGAFIPVSGGSIMPCI